MRHLLGLLLIGGLWLAYLVWSQPLPVVPSLVPVAVVEIRFLWGRHRYALYPSSATRCRVAFRGDGCAGPYGVSDEVAYSEASRFYWSLRRRFAGRPWSDEDAAISGRVLVGPDEWRGELTESDREWLHSTWCSRVAGRWDLEEERSPIPEIPIPGWDSQR